MTSRDRMKHVRALLTNNPTNWPRRQQNGIFWWWNQWMDGRMSREVLRTQYLCIHVNRYSLILSRNVHLMHKNKNQQKANWQVGYSLQDHSTWSNLLLCNNSFVCLFFTTSASVIVHSSSHLVVVKAKKVRYIEVSVMKLCASEQECYETGNSNRSRTSSRCQHEEVYLKKQKAKEALKKEGHFRRKSVEEERCTEPGSGSVAKEKDQWRSRCAVGS